MTFILCCVQVLNKVITVYAALCSEVKKLKHEVSMIKTQRCEIGVVCVFHLNLPTSCFVFSSKQTRVNLTLRVTLQSTLPFLES